MHVALLFALIVTLMVMVVYPENEVFNQINFIAILLFSSSCCHPLVAILVRMSFIIEKVCNMYGSTDEVM